MYDKWGIEDRDALKQKNSVQYFTLFVSNKGIKLCAKARDSVYGSGWIYQDKVPIFASCLGNAEISSRSPVSTTHYEITNF